MKSLVLSLSLMLGACAPCLASVWGDFKDQVFDQTRVTIHKSGGVAGFYDASVGGDYSLKQGVLSHVLTNRYISGSLGWYTANSEAGVIVGGPSLSVNEIVKTFFPEASESVAAFVPVLRPLSLGFNYGWGTDDKQHYGFHLVWNFGKTAE